MAGRLPLIVITAAILIFLALSSFFIVNERQQAIVLRFGEIVDVKTEPGIYFKAPFPFLEADTVQIIEDRILRFDLDDMRVQVSGGKFYEVDAFVAYRIDDPRVFRQTVSPRHSVNRRSCAVKARRSATRSSPTHSSAIRASSSSTVRWRPTPRR